MVTYTCAHCGVTENASNEQRLLDFWEVVPRSGDATQLRYCGTGCLIEAAEAAALSLGSRPPESIEEAQLLLDRISDGREPR